MGEGEGRKEKGEAGRERGGAIRENFVPLFFLSFYHLKDDTRSENIRFVITFGEKLSLYESFREHASLPKAISVSLSQTHWVTSVHRSVT